MAETLTVKVDRNADDYVALLKFMQGAFWRSPRMRMLQYGCAVAASVAALAFMLLIHPFRELSFALQLIVAITLYFGFRAMMRAAIFGASWEKLYRPGPGYATEVHYSAGPDALYTTGVDGESKVPWAAFKTMSETAAYFFLSLDDVRVIAIPKRGFADSTATRTFGDALRERIAVAHGEQTGDRHG